MRDIRRLRVCCTPDNLLYNLLLRNGLHVVRVLNKAQNGKYVEVRIKRR